jgi:hypothetical protein
VHVSPLHERRCRFGGFPCCVERRRTAGHSTQPEDGRHVHQLLPHHSHHSPSCHHQVHSCSASAPSPCKCNAAKRSWMAATSGSIGRSLGWPEGKRSLERFPQRPGGGRAMESADDYGGRGQRDGDGRWAGGARETRGTRAPLKAAWGRHWRQPAPPKAATCSRTCWDARVSDEVWGGGGRRAGGLNITWGATEGSHGAPLKAAGATEGSRRHTGGESAGVQRDGSAGGPD